MNLCNTFISFFLAFIIDFLFLLKTLTETLLKPKLESVFIPLIGHGTYIVSYEALGIIPISKPALLVVL